MSEFSTQPTDQMPGYELRPREVLLDTARHLLLSESNQPLGDEEVVESLQAGFQKNIEQYFLTSGVSDEVDALDPANGPLDIQALDLMAKKYVGGRWLSMLPNLCKEYPNEGMNCAMRGAMLHLALERLGFSGVRSAILEGHQVVFHELDDGNIRLYDPTLTVKTKDKYGYIRTFTPDHQMHKIAIDEGPNRQGFIVTFARGGAEGASESSQPNDRYLTTFYAYSPVIKMDLAVALENLSEVKDDAGNPEVPSDRSEHAQKLLRRYPILQHLDFGSIKQQFDLFDGFDIIRQVRTEMQLS